MERRIENLEFVSGKIGDGKEQARKNEELIVLLKMNTYYQRKMELTLAPEAILLANMEEVERVVAWYEEYSALSPEAKALRDREQKAEVAEMLEQCKAFLASAEYRQFEMEYADFKKKSGTSSIVEEKH